MSSLRHLLLIGALLPSLFLTACEECPTFEDCEGSDRDGSGEIVDTVDDDTEISGESVYADNCASCHGTDGDTGYAADLTKEVPGLSDMEIEDVIVNGVGTAMPGFPQLSDDELSDLVDYVAVTWGN